MSFDLGERRCLVIGAGKTGRSVVAFLLRRGARVRMLERSPAAVEAAALPASVEVRGGEPGEDLLTQIDLVVPSPGVPAEHPVLRRAAARGIAVWSEIELASRCLSCPILAVTGTNGKSTTTVLLGAMLAAAGREVFVGGNLGTPLIDACADDARWDAAVVEVSSFQLEWVQTFRPAVAILLNLTPDHLDRYPDLETYGRTKSAILAAQQPGDVAVLNRDDPWAWEQRRSTRAAVISFGREPVEFGTFIAGDTLTFRGSAPLARRFPLEEVRLQGAHNRENMMAAVTAAAIWGVPDAAIQRALETTPGLPHRMEVIGERAGVRFVDDSKGTNVGAVEKSVLSIDRDLILLLGGYDKGSDFSRLGDLLIARAKHVILFGAAAAKIDRQLHGLTRTVVPDLSSAVAEARRRAVSGDVVLLSPGCASFDEFTDYAARGRRFRELVEAS
jgi:UDP-N-acetylmuramoylalanine--D-glutamate ligase